MPERTANPHNHIEIVAVHERQIGHRHAAQFAYNACSDVAATRALCEYDRIARAAPRNPSVVFPVAPMAHCDLDSITSIRALREHNSIAFGEHAKLCDISHAPSTANGRRETTHPLLTEQ